MDPDLQRVSTPITLKRDRIPVNHKDSGGLLEASKSRYKALRNIHMEGLP